jgi:hypothetical protein
VQPGSRALRRGRLGAALGERLVWEENSPKKNRCYKSLEGFPKPQTPQLPEMTDAAMPLIHASSDLPTKVR